MSISLLRRLLMKEAVKDTAGSSGIMSINKNIAAKVEQQVQKYINDAMRQGVDLDTLSPEQLKMIVQINKPKPPRVIAADSPEGRGITEALLGKRGEVIKADFGKPFAQEIDDIADKKVIEQMYRTAGPRSLDEDAGYLAEFIADDAGKVLDDLPTAEQNKFIERAKNALKKNVKKYQEKSVKTDAQIKAEIEASNKKGIAGIKNKRQLTEDEYQNFLDEVGGADQLEAYDFDGTVGSANKIKKQQADYMAKMQMEYRKGKLDPEPGSGTSQRKRFLQKKLEEAEASGDARLMSREEREELFDLDNIEDFANGGVAGLLGEKTGYAAGGPTRQNFAMGRRAFLKLMGSVGAGIGAAKAGLGSLFKAGKPITKAAEIVTPAAKGKPEWFDALVTRVINEGDDVTKKFATKDREIVHTTKIDDDATVTVYRDLNTDNVRVDIDDATKNVMDDQGNATVSLEVRSGKSLADETTGKTTPGNEFEAVETDYRNYMDGPDDFVTENVENVVSDTKDLTADLTKVKLFAKGQKKPTIKEIMIQRDRAKTLKQAEDTPAEYAADRGPDYDPSDYATGGRVSRSGGGIMKLLKLLKFKPKKLETVKDFISKRQFLKSMVGNTEKNKKARELKMLKEAVDKAREKGGFKFKDVDVEKDIRPIFDQSKDRTLNSTGGLANMLGE